MTNKRESLFWRSCCVQAAVAMPPQTAETSAPADQQQPQQNSRWVPSSLPQRWQSRSTSQTSVRPGTESWYFSCARNRVPEVHRGVSAHPFLLLLPYTNLPLHSPASSRWSSKHYYRSIPSPITLSLSPHLPTTAVILVLLTPTSASEGSLRSLYKRQSQGAHIFNWDSGFLSLLFLCSSCVIVLFPKPTPYTPAMFFADALFDHRGGSWSVTAGTGIGPNNFGSSPVLPSGWALSSSTDFDLQANGTEVWQSLVFYSFLVCCPASLSLEEQQLSCNGEVHLSTPCSIRQLH